MSTIKISILLICLTLSSIASAHSNAWTVPELKRVGRGESIPSRVLTVVSAQSEHEAIWQAARYLDSFTRATGMEGCGLIERRNETVEIIISTNFSQIACKIPTARNGFETDGETIHSHPLASKVRANPVDAIWGKTKRGYLLFVSPESFSRRDRHNGAGYLVAMGQLLYQNGDEEKNLGVVATRLALE